jgi:hypothetical protein
MNNRLLEVTGGKRGDVFAAELGGLPILGNQSLLKLASAFPGL